MFRRLLTQRRAKLMDIFYSKYTYYFGIGVLGGFGAVGAYALGRSSALSTWSRQSQRPIHTNDTANGLADKSHVGQSTPGVQRNSTWSATGDTIFSFGDDGRYFFATHFSSTDNDAHLCTSSTTNYGLLNTGIKDQMVRPYFYAWTSSSDELLGYKDVHTGRPTWQFRTEPSRPSSASSYNCLLRWLGENVNTEEEMLQTKIIFGPGASYFAQCGNKCTYHDLPARLMKNLLKMKYATSDPGGNPKSWIPRVLALGADNNFVAIWHDGSNLWCLENLPHMNSISAELRKDGGRAEASSRWENIVLSPFKTTDFMTVMKTGDLKWHNTGTDKSNLDILVQGNLYTQLRAREDGSTYSMMQTANGVTKAVTISPETNYSGADFRAMFKKPRDTKLKVDSIYERLIGLLW